MIAGLSFQVLSLIVFAALCAEFTFRVYRAQSGGLSKSMTAAATGESSKEEKGNLLGFELSLVAATVFILVRSIYRCAELAGGFRGKLANEEVPFMLLEGMMMAVACLCLTIWHPGWVMKNGWNRNSERGQDVEISLIGGERKRTGGAT
jgi:hypothetical protein